MKGYFEQLANSTGIGATTGEPPAAHSDARLTTISQPAAVHAPMNIEVISEVTAPPAGTSPAGTSPAGTFMGTEAQTAGAFTNAGEARQESGAPPHSAASLDTPIIRPPLEEAVGPLGEPRYSASNTVGLTQPSPGFSTVGLATVDQAGIAQGSPARDAADPWSREETHLLSETSGQALAGPMIETRAEGGPQEKNALELHGLIAPSRSRDLQEGAFSPATMPRDPPGARAEYRTVLMGVREWLSAPPIIDEPEQDRLGGSGGQPETKSEPRVGQPLSPRAPFDAQAMDRSMFDFPVDHEPGAAFYSPRRDLEPAQAPGTQEISLSIGTISITVEGSQKVERPQPSPVPQQSSPVESKAAVTSGFPSLSRHYIRAL